MPVRAIQARPVRLLDVLTPRRLSLTLGTVAHGKRILVSGEIPLAIFDSGATFVLAMDSFSFV
jgi:hypothetical protein